MRAFITKVFGRLRGAGRQIATISISLVIGGAGSAAVLAAIPDANGVIHACYRTNGNAQTVGSVRIINSPTQTCNNNEAPITWNQTGPQGPAGPTGPQG